jgi:glycosyltransferase involved in cell wall biosynthesis
MAGPQRIFVLVQGLFEKSDSIGFDAIYQWQLLKAERGSSVEVRLFCENFSSANYPTVEAESLDDFREALRAAADAVVLYHFCDGWPEIEELLLKHCGNLVVRWHNNTPPWFIAKYALGFAERSTRGFTSIIRLAQRSNCRFWCNSHFTARQLRILGVNARRTQVVYPASRYLDYGPPTATKNVERDDDRTLILFVGRIVPHKGHRHDLLTAAYLQHRLGIPARVILPGRADPVLHEYTSEIAELAATLSVELSLPGEVGADELDELYRSASVFLCLSEHEGFGLPIFEAMRIGVPTASWTNTGIADLVHGHPLSHRELSPRWFAAAIAALQDSELRSHVLRWQEHNVLRRYTKDIVSAQVLSALNANTMPCLDQHQNQVSLALGAYHDGPAQEVLERTLKSYCDRIGDRPIGQECLVPRDIPEHFVTIYDVEAYRALFDLHRFALPPLYGRRGSDNGAESHGDSATGIFLSASQFVTTCGSEAEGRYICPLSVHGTHLIYGPYRALPEGTYRIEFLIEVVEAPEGSQGELVFDVKADAAAPLCQSNVSVRELREGKRVFLEFFQPRPEAQLEFRIASNFCPSGLLSFVGVNLARLAASVDLAEFAPPVISGDYPRLQPRRMLAAILGRRRSASRAAFITADQARDKGDWDAAAKLYARGLEFDGRRLDMWIQYGHALKEGGRIKQAEEAYEKALSLDPGNPDANLQLGHVLKLQGRLVDAVTYYARAAFLATRAEQSAREELNKLGLFGDGSGHTEP